MSDVKLVDGGFSTQLVKHVGPIVDGDPLWTARFLTTDKDKCILVHRDFIRAGANIIITASYQCSIEGYKAHLGLNEAEVINVIKESVILAKTAIQLEEKEQGRKLDVSVAGSVGPYGASLHDGSEYTGNYANSVSTEFLVDWHRPRVKALIEAGADVLAFETIPCSREAEALCTLIKEFPSARAWLSFSVKDEKSISSGESFREIAEKCWKIADGQLVAVGVNCLHPSLVTPVLQDLKDSSPHIPLIAYPNSGEKYDVKLGQWLGNEGMTPVTDYAEQWLKLGIAYLGGCCRTSDSDVSRFCEEIEQWKSVSQQ